MWGRAEEETRRNVLNSDLLTVKVQFELDHIVFFSFRWYKSHLHLVCVTGMMQAQASSKAESKTKTVGRVNLEPGGKCSQHNAANARQYTGERRWSSRVCLKFSFLFIPLHKCQRVFITGGGGQVVLLEVKGETGKHIHDGDMITLSAECFANDVFLFTACFASLDK